MLMRGHRIDAGWVDPGRFYFVAENSLGWYNNPGGGKLESLKGYIVLQIETLVLT